MKRICGILVACAVIASAPLLVHAQTWMPSRPITLVVAMAPGSSNDLIARTISEKLSAKLKQPVIVENRPGASGLVGAADIARSKPDGTSIAVVPSNVYMTPILSPGAGGAGFDIMKDTIPLLTAGTAPVVIVANPSIQVQTPKELVAYLKRNGPTSFGSPGIGSPMHVAGELLGQATGTQLTHVPYRGVLPAALAVMSGEVPLAIVTLAGIEPYITAKKLIAVALVEKRRSDLIPSVPTLTESGIPGVETVSFYQLLVPAATPAPIMEKLNSEINLILATPELKQTLRRLGVQITGGTTADAIKLARDTYARNQQMVKDFHITAE